MEQFGCQILDRLGLGVAGCHLPDLFTGYFEHLLKAANIFGHGETASPADDVVIRIFLKQKAQAVGPNSEIGLRQEWGLVDHNRSRPQKRYALRG